jgi:hypothetical protein
LEALSGRRLPALAAAAALAAVALVPCLPLGGRLPGVDSGVFLYTGRTWLSGGTPYLSAWDGKPPVIFALNALGLQLGAGAEAGVWALQLLLLTAAVALGYRVMEKQSGAFPAALATAVWVSALAPLLEGGNFPGQYALTAQFAVLALAGRPGTRPAAAVGALAAYLFWLKPNLVVVPTAWLFFASWKERGAAAAVFAALTAGLWAYLAAVGAAGAAWQAIYGYNSANVPAGLGARLASLREGVQHCWTALLPAAVGAALALRQGAPSPAARLCLVALPLELAACCFLGREYRHYFLPLLPSCAVLAAGAFKEGLAERSRQGAVVLAAAALTFVPTTFWKENVFELLRAGPDPVVDFLREKTPEGAPVLVWGVGPRYNFAAGRPSPTRWSNGHAFVRRGFASPAIVGELIEDLNARPAAAVVDLSGTDPGFPPIEPAARARWTAPPTFTSYPELDRALDALALRYVPAARFDGVAVYLPK